MAASLIRAGLHFFYKGVSLQRSDLVLEVSGTLDANGAHVTDWIDSGGINSIRFAAATAGTAWYVEQSIDAVTALGSTQPSAAATETFIAARYFRLGFSEGSSWANQPFTISVRRAS